MKPEDIKSLEDAKLWAAEHDGRIYAWWDTQHKFNKDINARLSAMEKRVIYIAGAAAGVMAFAGNALAIWVF